MRMGYMTDFKKTVRKFSLLRKGDSVVVGVSGGPDSVALLLALSALRKEFCLEVYAAHFNHGRRKTSLRDERFVRKLCERFGIVFFGGNAVAQAAFSEERARIERFAFLFDCARKVKSNTIALGHNLDDQAETVLMRLIRGAGLQGLSAMMPCRRMGSFRIIRPLIETNRQRINAYLRQRRISPCIDETNRKEVFFRNKIRLTLIPLLEQRFNKNIKGVLSATAATLGQDYDYLNSHADAVFRKCGGRLRLAFLLHAHTSLIRLLIRKAIARVQGDTRRITFQHMREIEDLIFERPVGSVVNLPHGVFLVKKKHYLQFSREQK